MTHAPDKVFPPTTRSEPHRILFEKGQHKIHQMGMIFGPGAGVHEVGAVGKERVMIRMIIRQCLAPRPPIAGPSRRETPGNCARASQHADMDVCLCGRQDREPAGRAREEPAMFGRRAAPLGRFVSGRAGCVFFRPEAAYSAAIAAFRASTIQASSVAISSALIRRPNFDRRQTTSAACRAYS